MKKIYILNGFASKEDAQKRNHEFALKSGIDENAATKFLFNSHCLVKEEWGLEINEDYLHLLDETEKNNYRLKEIPHQPYIHAYIPMVFRYIEETWVDDFINNGKIRLSSFGKFHTHIDEQRGDKAEGRNSVLGITDDNKEMLAVTSHGNDAFVLSTSLMLSEEIYNDFNVDSCFVIERPFEFMNSISNHIPEFKGINFGPCLYKPDRTIQRNLTNFTLENLKSADGSKDLDMGKMINTINDIGGRDVLFSKTNKYAHQHEYRFLWHSFLDKIPETIDIVAPEARQFCRKLARK